jgi:mono/diheme cytochrome c family protein
MSVVLLGVWPGRVLEEQTRRMSPSGPLPLTASERRGREVYSREGCAYCHTQQVRYVAADVRRFGAPTLAWETQFDSPHLLGTRRIGPDLARAGGTRSEDWHYLHLYAPRSAVAASVMPAYPWLFEGSPDRPRQAARDLVAYLETLGRARELAAPEGEIAARAACNCPDDTFAQMAFAAPALNAHPARARRSGDAPTFVAVADWERGLQLYGKHCASCHGRRGDRDDVAVAGLSPRPTALAEHEYSLRRLSEVMLNGVAGTAMPAWRDLTTEDRSAIAHAVRSFHRRQDELPIEPALAELGGAVYASHCVQCHGFRGAGDGIAARELRVQPTNFQLQRPSLAGTLQALRHGIDGTTMAVWAGRLSEVELMAVAHYVRRFYEGDDIAGESGR